ncbi:hypothetical protein [Trebonia sp.]|uniref:hypothetical protein n=1 Tax=Trebonia sp. TaxID=2767075 RepID=UPI0026214805|nr:hypothetical protein [Trebonia sp.]
MAKLAAEKAAGKTSTPPARPARKTGAARPLTLPDLGITVKDGVVYKTGFTRKRLGDLAGSHAELTDGTRPHRIGTGIALATVSLGMGAVAALTRKNKASAFIVFADGTTHEKKLEGKTAIGNAQRAAVRYNAAAAAATSNEGPRAGAD